MTRPFHLIPGGADEERPQVVLLPEDDDEPTAQEPPHRLPANRPHQDVDRPTPPKPKGPREVLAVVTRTRGDLALRTDRVRNSRAVPIAKAAARHSTLGSARILGAWWRWLTAADHAQALSMGKGEFVEAIRERRRKVALWSAGALGAGDLWGWAHDWWAPWMPPAGLVLGVLTVGGIVESIAAAKATDGDDTRRAIGTHPNSKAVRRLFVAGKLAKTIDEVRVVAPGVMRENNPPAWTCVVELPDGTTYDEALPKRPKLAASAGVGISRLYMDPVDDHEGRVRLWSPDRDPLSAPKVDCDLKGRTTAVDVWTERVPLGLSVRGEQMGFSMPGRSWLVGGEPEAGKSVACNILLCFAALDPHVKLWLVDGKGVDLLDYEDLADRAVLRPDPQAVLDLINEAREEMERRGAELQKLRVKKLTKALAQDLGWSMLVFHIDELAYFTKSELGKKIEDAGRDLTSRGRFVGIYSSAATQRPGSDVVDTGWRDLFSIRLAMRCTTPQASDMILGQGWAKRGYNAQLIDPLQRGSGLLYAEGSRPITGRTGYLDDDDVTRLTRVAYKLRAEAGTLPLSEDSPQRRLLRACLEAMGEADRMWTQDLLPRVHKVPEFAGLDDVELARRLRECQPEVTPTALWLADSDGTKRSRNGYTRADLVAALERRR
ncbi:FtsK/SpoIIIE domain-containing protein [Microbispora sp. KK1-11]|uniref:FtsK/SpoIIIE domain-containing protein n=1 Tax=Microbispora sp. KK1-11 TaxID=2053005 RepID=UPI00115A4774|nr:FtsK/SpoIIIE domain-containing protein [Microbispora sp. KK1-11]TQS30077.1 hypothetical protein FLW16_06865 [Microbispora sp. KK1-11]